MLDYNGIIYKTFVAKQKELFFAEKTPSRQDIIRFGHVNLSSDTLWLMGFNQISVWFQNWLLGDIVSDFDGDFSFFVGKL